MINYFEEYIPQNKSLYEFLEEKSMDYDNKTAISFYGKNITYKTMFERIEEIAQALRSYGVKKDDVIASSLPGTPEGIYLIYAINKIGARYCAFDCRSKKEDILETIKTFNPKLCFIPDFQVNEFKEIKDFTIIHINPIHSLGGIVKFPSFFSDFFTGRDYIYITHKNIIPYDKFIKSYSEYKTTSCEKSSDDIFGYFYTSGTTYGRKSIILTNENINAAVLQQKNANKYINEGDSILNIMPLFTCYSVTLAVHLPLICGVRVNLIPLVNIRNFKKILINQKPNFIITVPAHWEYFIKEDFNNCDLSFLKMVTVGGDVVDSSYEDKINSILKKCNSKAFLSKGYGLSETASTATVNLDRDFKEGVGYPLANTLIKIYDSDKKEFLSYGMIGEICIYSPTVCKGYFKDEKMTNELLQLHDDGKIWLHSGDMGYMDENGRLYFCERKKRMYVRFDGTKVSPYSIEKVIDNCNIVKQCMVVSIKDSEHSHGMCAKALIVLNEGVNENKAEEKLHKFFQENLGQHMIPKEIVIVKQLPFTKNGKRDYFSTTET